MRIIVKEGDSVLADLSFEEDEDISIGSQPDSDIRLPEDNEHVALVSPTEEGVWFIENLDPDRQILINSRELVGRVGLSNRDEIALDRCVLCVELEDEEEQPVFEEPQLSAEELAKIRQFPLPPGSLVRHQSDVVNLGRYQIDRIAKAVIDIGESRDLHDLVDRTLNQLLDVFKAGAAWIGIRRHARGELEIQGSRLPSGQAAGSNAILELLLYRCVERGQYVAVRKVRDHSIITSALGVPLVTSKGILGILYVDRRQKARRFRSRDLDLLSAFATHLSAKLVLLMKGHMQRTAEISAAEVGVAHAIQAQLDPTTPPTFERLQMAAYCRSGQESPGDVYDVMQHPDSGLTTLLLGHVNATGASLGLSMARLHSTFRVGFLHNDPPHALARALNWLMYSEKDPSTVDASFVLIDPESGKIKYARAGKVGAFIVSVRGEPRALQGADAPSIGQVRNYKYMSHSEQLAPGETLALYTRGVASCTNEEGSRFGEHRFIGSVCDAFCQPPATTVKDLADELTSFFERGKHADDITIILLHRMPDD